MPRHVRNVLIIVALAAVIWKVPGGDTTGDAIANLLSILLLGGLAFFAARLYMEHRMTLMTMPDGRRTLLYASIALIALAIAATSRLWDTGAGVAIWFAMLGAAAYGLYTVYVQQRAY